MKNVAAIGRAHVAVVVKIEGIEGIAIAVQDRLRNWEVVVPGH